MDPDHNSPPIPTGVTGQSSQSQGQPSQPEVQGPGSPFVEPEHVDRGDRPQSQSLATEEPLPGGSEGDHPQGRSVTEKPLLDSSEGHSPARDRIDRHPEFEPTQPPPVARNFLRDGNLMRGPSRRSVMGHTRSNASGIGWIVPEVDEKPHRRTIGERLDPTIANAVKERAQYASKARMTGLALNIAIGMQVILGALTTGISAATSGRQTSIGISILGGMTTMVASYLARARGSNEPELSITRVKDLDHFLRDCLAFKMDCGHEYGTPELDDRLEHLRKRFEELLGNADGQRKLSPPV
ncbi:hypothetical protein DFJ58DRAFT_771918 [Suillus subalutaceus]|uniref:uncharacterized protein n=1 Tax=Suillus subalutaceus TaxID=48586 RepID=UPI001B86CB63|nr:uncharacterized protein DFJ58DRAFT_771918 [Suillus subalutaceus]KAG1864995.1 hypothetical protein DFJ58DRAFT_771918 [Suillus subalutaceus]